MSLLLRRDPLRFLLMARRPRCFLCGKRIGGDVIVLSGATREIRLHPSHLVDLQREVALGRMDGRWDVPGQGAADESR